MTERRPVVCLFIPANPTKSEKEHRYRRHSRASTPEMGRSKDSGFELAALLLPSATARPNGSRGGLGTLGGRDRIAHELGRARKSWKRAQKEEGGSRGGEGGIYGCPRKAAKAVAHAPSPIRGPLNLGSATARLILLYLILFIDLKLYVKVFGVSRKSGAW